MLVNIFFHGNPLLAGTHKYIIYKYLMIALLFTLIIAHFLRYVNKISTSVR